METKATSKDLIVRLADVESRLATATSRDGIRAAALDGAELCMRALKISSNHNEKKTLDEKCRKFLNQAELIKDANQQPLISDSDASDTICESQTTATTTANLKLPVSNRELSTREQILLLQGSKLHGCLFPPWKAPPAADEFRLEHGEQCFVDPTAFQFSNAQKGIFNGWVRPKDEAISHNHRLSGEQSREAELSMVTHNKIDLVQDMTSDCSIVASICAIIARAEKGYDGLLSSFMYPFDMTHMKHVDSSNGKYVFKLHFNGCFRRVIIDNRLPASSSKRTLHVKDRSNQGLLWPALIEKAYLKVRGGYDFPGSNSGTDLLVLTGWIPEQLFLQSDDLLPDAIWRRVYNAFNYGDVLVTLGTGRLTPREEEGMGLAGEHDYTIIDMKETENGRRLFLVKDPWSEGSIWNYQRHSEDKQLSVLGNLESNGRLFLNDLVPGTFWVDMDGVFRNFESIYLNWNPALFSYRQDVHFRWDLRTTRSPLGSFDKNPQYTVQSIAGGIAWFLLSRHFQDEPETTAMAERSCAGFMSLCTFDRKGYRSVLSDGALIRSPYVDSSNILLRLDLPAGSVYTIVVSEQELPLSAYTFSLSAFSLKPLKLEEATEKYRYSITTHAAWTVSTSGGNANSASYHLNPQFSVDLPSPSDLALLIVAENQDLPVHLKLVRTNGQRISHITNRDVIIDSGDYRKGSALAEIQDVQPGTYSVICSTFEQGLRGKFSLRIQTMVKCSFKSIPLEEAGCLLTRVPRAAFGSGTDRLLVPLQVHRITRIRARARQPVASKVANLSPLKMSLEHGQGPYKKVLAVSGDDEFVNNLTELRMDDIDVMPGMCQGHGIWLVLERLGGTYLDAGEVVDIELLSDSPLEVGPWGQESHEPVEITQGRITRRV